MARLRIVDAPSGIIGETHAAGVGTNSCITILGTTHRHMVDNPFRTFRTPEARRRLRDLVRARQDESESDEETEDGAVWEPEVVVLPPSLAPAAPSPPGEVIDLTGDSDDD